MTAPGGPVGSPLGPVRGWTRGLPPGIVLLALVAAVVGAIAVAVATAPPPRPAPSFAAVSPSPSASGAPSPVASPGLSPSPAAPATASTVIVLRDVTDPAGVLATLAGCTPVHRVTGAAAAAIKGADVDSTAAAAGRDTGWLFVPPGIQAVTRVWLGNDVVALAQAAGRQVVAIGTRGDVWLGGPSGATRWHPVPTPAGRTAWVITNDEVTGGRRCGPWTVPGLVAGQRSLDCAGLDLTTCLIVVEKVRGDLPGIDFPGGGFGVSVQLCRQRNPGCTLMPLIVEAVPSGWTGDPAEMRAATLQSETAGFTALGPSVVPDAALANVSLAALPLPTSASVPTSCRGTLRGRLSAAPWDPRVAWVGSSSVVWPPGTTVRFTPLFALTVPRPGGSVRFALGMTATLRGATDPRTKAFVACSAG